MCAVAVGLESNFFKYYFLHEPETQVYHRQDTTSVVSFHYLLEARLLSLTSLSAPSVFSAVTDAYQMAGRGCSCWLVRSSGLQI